jgi:enoyl-CoA hydratase/carnithine racemase
MEIARLAHDEGARSLFRIAMDSAMTAICQVPVPVVAEIDGACFGAGVALALSCDIRIAGEKARFGITPAKLGISYPYKDVARLYAAVGRGHASDLLFTAKTIDAEEARRIGLVERVVPDAQPATLTVARSGAANATESNAALKTMLVHCEGEFTEEFDRTFEAMFDRPAFHKRIGSL